MVPRHVLCLQELCLANEIINEPTGSGTRPLMPQAERSRSGISDVPTVGLSLRELPSSLVRSREPPHGGEGLFVPGAVRTFAALQATLQAR